MTLSKQIEERIENATFGSIFVITDFTDLSSYDVARKTLSRLEAEKKIVKACRGIYYKPKYSRLLGETVAPDMNGIAEAIARNFGWVITPSGENALNMLGLSTQVPGRYSYISSGPYKSYDIGNSTIEFAHRSDKDINGKSYQTRLVIQAIKAIGKDKIACYIPEFRKKISKNDKRLILKEGQRSTAWTYAAIKEINKENEDVSDSKKR